MKGWEKNVVLYAETHAAGACPVCGKNNVTVQEHISGNRHQSDVPLPGLRGRRAF